MEKIFVTKTTLPPFEDYIAAIKPLWDSHWLTNMGELHNHLEVELTHFLNVPYISLITNGHFALELAIQSMNFAEGSEIITTPFTFISTTHAIVRNRLKPVFCDVNELTCTINADKIENLITEKTVAIIPTHVYGNICQIEKIDKIAKRHNLKVIYDAAHAFGEKYKNHEIGLYGDLSIFSFHATKVFHTIEGGAICCHSQEKYDQFYNLKNFGIRSEEFIEEVGANAKMNEFQAAMGLCNLRYIDGWITERQNLYNLYLSLIGNRCDIRVNRYDKNVTPNYAYMPVFFQTEEIRNNVYQLLRKNQIYSRKYFYPLTSDAQCFGNQYLSSNLPVARKLSKTVLTLPIYIGLKIEQVEYICNLITVYLNKHYNESEHA